MQNSKYIGYRVLVAAIIAGVTGWSVVSGHSLIVPLIVIAVGGFFLVMLRKRVTEVVRDERTQAISQRAARLTMSVFAPACALLALAFIMLGQSDLKQAGYTLAYATCGLMIIYDVFYFYLNRRG